MTLPSEPVPLAPSARLALPLVDQAPTTERADAARNRAKLLEAAAALIKDQGAEHLTMDALAAAACVGKGTVFRRFGDRLGLLFAVLDRTESEFQQAFMFGPAPLGPGADPVARLNAFGGAALRHLHANMDVYLESDQQASARYNAAPRRVRARHVTMLLRAAGVEGDLELLTGALLSTLDPAPVHHMLTERGHTVERLEAGWCDLVARITHRC
ncbi:TetR/AcrR family transcriptional regulator [Streptacidiphilus jiangxiensis]|uniref:DNA-binding transcriptional regulator, AcrR family n=1 Tax=Streptacidiphilus jiangxiensis TaxID=235985 RepID=A0A1H7UAL2_STRJI|nr:TetR/AcrR family transcriptional regulator [Streptacidiphilus jiangxiensis]SEL94102.1 DNA-binding transcriptional regulator, AcrR family [Streptacidiphilus jiangxiensis]